AGVAPGAGPAPGREDATDPPVYEGVGTARCRPVRGRDRPAAVPALASLLGAARGRRRGPPVRSQREAGALRRTQPLQRDTAVPGAEEAVERRLPGVLMSDSSVVQSYGRVA